MTTYVTFLLLGLGNGAVFAAIGVSLTIAYRTSAVVNFGAGAMALFGAVTFQSLRTQQAVFNPLAMPWALTIVLSATGVGLIGIRLLRGGQLRSPHNLSIGLLTVVMATLSRLPVMVGIGSDLGTAWALVVTCALGSLFGLAVYTFVFRHLRNALALTRVVAAVGILLVVPGIVQNRLGNGPISSPPVLPAAVWHISQIVIQENQVLLAAVVLGVAGSLAVLYRRTRFGHQTTAAAETDVGATIMGISPNFIGGANWAIGGAVAGLFGALIVSITPVAPTDFALFVVPGLAAAMLGGMSSLGWAVCGGVAIGMLESEAQYLQTHFTFLPRQGLSDLVPLLLLVIVMIVRSKELPERGTLVRRAVPPALAPVHVRLWTAVLSGAGLVLAFTLHGGYLVAFATTLVGFVLALSLVVLTGYVGQISLAQYMFAGAAAFLLSRLTENWGVPFPLAPLAAALAVAIVGALLSVPAVRVRGVELAVLTLSAGVAAESIYFSNAVYIGGNGTPTVVPPALFGAELSIGTPGHYPRSEFVVMLIVVVVPLAIAVVGVRRSSLGLQMLAVRANERAAAANGINVALIKVIAFGLSAFLAGLAGSLIAYMNYGGFSSASFDAFLSLSLVASVFIVGISSMSGAVLAAFAFAGGLWAALLQRYIPFQTWYGVFAGAALTLSAVTVPEGVAVQIVQWRGAVRRRARELPPQRWPAQTALAASLGADMNQPVALASAGEAEESTLAEGPPGARHE